MRNSENDVNVRNAAQSIYDNIIAMNFRGPQTFTSNLARSHSINLITEEFLGGYMQDGRMSVVRRFFCLFVTFDLFFISLLWLICILITGDDIFHALKVQVVHYSVQKSLFDVVMAAICRFVVLILFYALLYINHWFIIALSTSGSCFFLISKVFVYDWVGSHQPVFEVVLIITSFVLAWGEAWFLDCRVIPQERRASNYFLAIAATQHLTADRSSIITAPFLSSDVTGGHPPDSVANFYSPYDSNHDSDDENEQDEEYRTAGIECVKKAYEILESCDWKIEKVTKKGDTIKSTQREKLGKIYRLTGIIKYPAKALSEELFYKIEEVPKWNPTLLESKIVRKIDSHTDITYQATTGGGGGLVKSRDFVNLRCYQVMRNGKILHDDEDNDKNDNSDDDSNYEISTAEGSVSSIYNETDDDNEPLIKKSISENTFKNNNDNSISSSANITNTNINSSNSDGTTATFRTLSKSLGARDFHDVSTMYTEPPPLNNTNEYLDARDHFESLTPPQLDQPSSLIITTTIATPTTIATGATALAASSSLLVKPTQSIKDNSKIYISAAISVVYPNLPSSTKYIRGENLISCWAMREVEGKRDSCIFEWLLCLDLKGYIPKYVLDTAYGNLMQDYMRYLRKYCNELRQKQRKIKDSKLSERAYR